MKTCPYEGSTKVVREDHVSKLYCAAHAADWQRRFGGRVVRPRKMDDKEHPCLADWALPAEVP